MENSITKAPSVQMEGKFGKIIEKLQQSAVKPGVDLAGIIEQLRKRREKKKNG